MIRRRHQTALVASRVLGPGSRRSGPRAWAVAGGAAALLAAGCGSSHTPTAPLAGSSTAVSPAATTTPVATSTTVAAAATQGGSASAAELRKLHQQVVAALRAAHHRHGRYGGQPSFLPAPPHRTGRTVTADPAHPALAIEGATVHLELASARSLAVAVGPSIPENVAGTAARQTPARFTITFHHVSGAFPVAPRLFTIIDELGRLIHPRVSVAGHPATSGSRLSQPGTVTLTTVLPVGNGTLRYAPSGGHYLAAWDFDVETD